MQKSSHKNKQKSLWGIFGYATALKNFISETLKKIDPMSRKLQAGFITSLMHEI